MSNRGTSDFVEIDNLETVAKKIGTDVRVIGSILSKEPDFIQKGIDYYHFDKGDKNTYGYIIGVDGRHRNSA